MKKSVDRRIAKLAEQLEVAQIDRDIIRQIMEGGEAFGKSAGSAEIAEWFRGAMIRMNKLLDMAKRKAVREGCACHLTGQKLRICEKIVRENKSLEERIKAVNAKNYICGTLTMNDNGEIIACARPDDRYYRHCVCLPKAQKPLSITYCYCCGGHIKYHLQIALGHKLDGGVVTSPLSTGGKSPCTFSFRILA